MRYSIITLHGWRAVRFVKSPHILVTLRVVRLFAQNLTTTFFMYFVYKPLVITLFCTYLIVSVCVCLKFAKMIYCVFSEAGLFCTMPRDVRYFGTIFASVRCCAICIIEPEESPALKYSSSFVIIF